MPNIDNLNQKTFPKNHRDHLLNVRRGDILYREDIQISFGYALFGITVTLAIAGGVYVIGKQLLK
jgi:hypothetical protein